MCWCVGCSPCAYAVNPTKKEAHPKPPNTSVPQGKTTRETCVTAATNLVLIKHEIRRIPFRSFLFSTATFSAIQLSWQFDKLNLNGTFLFWIFEDNNPMHAGWRWRSWWGLCSSPLFYGYIGQETLYKHTSFTMHHPSISLFFMKKAV